MPCSSYNPWMASLMMPHKDDGKSAVMVSCRWLSDGSSAVTLFCRFPRMAFLPLFSGVVSLNPSVEVIAEYLCSAGHSVVRGKKKPVHRRTDPSGSFPLAGVLVWLSMYRLKSRIQFVLYGIFSLAYGTGVCQYSFSDILCLFINSEKRQLGLSLNIRYKFSCNAFVL